MPYDKLSLSGEALKFDRHRDIRDENFRIYGHA